MAVVLPNYGHIEFTSENEYKSHCQNDAADTGEESAQDETNLSYTTCHIVSTIIILNNL